MTRHLIHVGFPKAGSKFLQRWFETHPQIRYAEGGIAGYRDVFDMARQTADGQAAAPWAVTSYEGLTAPRSSAGSTEIDYAPLDGLTMGDAQEAACAALAALFAGAHILIVTRGFRDMILSSYSQYVRSGGTEDLADLVRAGTDDHPWSYDRITRLYRQHFGEDRLILLPYELLRRDPARFILGLEQRLGVDPHPASTERFNASLSNVEMRWYPRLTRAVDRLPLPGRLRRAIRTFYVSRTMDNGLRLPIRLLQRLHPLEPIGDDSVPGHVLDRFRGEASLLASEPLYAPFANDYLL